MIRKDGVLKLMDFGIAQVRRSAAHDRDRPAAGLAGLHGARAHRGQAARLSHRRLLGRHHALPAGHRQPALRRQEPARGAAPDRRGQVPRPAHAEPAIGDGLARIIARALARNPDDRYPDVEPLRRRPARLPGRGGADRRRAPSCAPTSPIPTAYEAALPARLAPALIASAERAAGGRPARAAHRAVEPGAGVRPEERGGAGGAAPPRGPRAASSGSRWLAAWSRPPCWAAPGCGCRRGAPAAYRAAAGGAPAAATAAPPAAAAGRPAAPGAALARRRRRPTATGRASRTARGAPAAPCAEDRRPSRAAQAPRPPPAPTRAGATRTFTLGPTPQNVDVYLDGEKTFAYDTDHTTITVPWTGDHVIELRSPAGCCFGERIEVGPDRPLPPDDIIARRLKWKPAHLVVTTDPPAPGARHGQAIPTARPAATAGARRRGGRHPFFADRRLQQGGRGRRRHGDAFTSEKLTVRAGQRLTHVVKLKTSATEMPRALAALAIALPGGWRPAARPAARRQPPPREASSAGAPPSGGPSTGAPSSILRPLLYPECGWTARARWSRRTACWASPTCSRTSPTRPSASSASCWSCAPTTASIRCSTRRGWSTSSTACVKEEEGEIAALEARAQAARRRAGGAPAARGRRGCAAQARDRAYEQHSYAVNFIPFGAGQFQNGQRGKGWAFLGIEAALGAISLGAFVDQLRAVRRPAPAPLPGCTPADDTTGVARSCR